MLDTEDSISMQNTKTAANKKEIPHHDFQSLLRIQYSVVKNLKRSSTLY